MTQTITSEVKRFLEQSPKTHFIDGKWPAAANGARWDVMDPSSGEAIATIPLGGPAEVDRAVAAAQKAFGAWSAMPVAQRSVLLHRLADAIQKHAADIAQIEALDVGKAVVNAEAFDVPFGTAGIRYFADLAAHAVYDVPLPLANIEAWTHRVPYGVCGFIFPWNFPFDLLMWGVMPALAAGNTVVVKPSEITPLSTLYVCELALEAGIPPGVINVVLGDGKGVGSPLCSHPGIRRMSFTGSPGVGKLIGEICGRNLVPCKLELGGKGAAVVFDDVDVDAAAKQLAAAITLNTGQVCCTATRWLVHEKIFDRFVERATESLRATTIGPALDRSTQMGPLASQTHRERVLRYIDQGKAQGATALLDGGALRVAGREKGYYVSPVLLTGKDDNICCREEVFGPTAFLMKFRDEAAAIGVVNQLQYGLANSVWSSDLQRAKRVAEKLVAGNSWINAHNVFAYGLPYGGTNLSGTGGGVNSPETFNDYLRNQTIARPLA